MTVFQQQRSPWIDSRLQQLPSRPWRKIHLDYHNSHHIPRLATDFDTDEFGERLGSAHVDAIVIFAKDMHGFFYYPNRHGPVHPGITFDLLGSQVEACRQRNIKVYAYYCVTWDHYLAEHHPEWLVWKRDRTTYLPRFDETPGWTALCLTNEDFVQLVLDHTHEIITSYDLDGIWYDMPLPIAGECFCRNCLTTIRKRGSDPFDLAAQRYHKQELLVDFMRRTHDLAHTLKPGIQVDQNNQTRLGLEARAPYLDNIDIEALPTAFWGYLYFPANVRYARTFGKSVYGMTGRFHRSWADFGGLKHPNQLRTELAGIIAQGACCDIGDQLPPSGRLDPAVYATIGQVYGEIRRLEPFLKQAAPAVEAAIVVDGLPLEDVSTVAGWMPTSLGSSVFGLTKLLMEHHIQFDVIHAADELRRYRLLVLPDTLAVDEVLAARLQEYLGEGGAIVAAHDALRIAGTDRLWAKDLGLRYEGSSPFVPAYLKLGAELTAALPDYEYALYDGTAQWRLEDGNVDDVLARVGEPLFQRSPEHYTSHSQTPMDHVSDYVAIARYERLAATAFPIASSYYRHGYWIYRELFGCLLRSVLPERLIETNAPISTEIALTHQVATAEHSERWMVHVVNFSPSRRTPAHTDYVEDPIPLHDIRLDLALDAEIKRAYTAAEGAKLVLNRHGGRWCVIVPRVEISEIVVLEAAER
jgi:hypothetical protein